MAVAETKAIDVSIKQVLHEEKYEIDYYQRDYSWGKPEVRDLLDDLLGKFFNNYSKGQEIEQVANYEQYFLGSFVLSTSNGVNFIIDGQQRLTTLTLIYMYFSQRGINCKSYVYSDLYRKNEWNIKSPERNAIMHGITDYGQGKPVKQEILEHNIFLRYKDIAQILSEKFPDDSIDYFYYWLSEKVRMVKINAYSNNEAYTIFETMNDRGKPLTTIDMLKGFILSSVPDDNREEAKLLWAYINSKVNNMDSFFKNVLRGRFCQTSYHTGGKNSDWARIIAVPHRWLRENAPAIGIKTGKDYLQFLKDLKYYTDLHVKIESYKINLVPGKEDVCYLAMKGMSNLDIVLYAGINPNDEFEEEKISAICRFLDIYTANQIWAGVDYNYPASSVNTVARLIKNIRTSENDIDFFVYKLYKNLESVTFEGTPLYTPKGRRREYVKSVLARLTSFMEVSDNKPDPWVTLWVDNYEIEHLLSSKYEQNKEFINSEEELEQFRDSIGSLGLLDKNTNSSLGDKPYREKIIQYTSHNRLLGVLSNEWYDSNNTFRNHPGLSQLVDNNPKLKNLLVPYPEQFTQDESDKRTELYRELSKIIWDTSSLLEYTSCYDFAELLDYVKQEYLDTGKYAYEEEKSNKYSYYVPSQEGGAYTEIEVLEDGKIMLLKLDNARTINLISDNARKKFASSFIQKLYDEITKTMTVNGSGYYNWEGFLEIPKRYVAASLLTGHSGSGSNAQWARI